MPRLKIGDASYTIPEPEPLPESVIGRPKTIGASGLGLTEFMFTLFESNEASKYTDGQLLSVLKQEYRALPNVLARLEKPGVIPSYRSKYNSGAYGVVTRYSFRYDDQKQPLKRGCRSIYTKEEQLDLVQGKGINDDRFVLPPRKSRKARRSVKK